MPPSSSLSALSLLVTCGVHAEYKTKVGIAQAVASVKFPANMIVAGGSDGNSATRLTQSACSRFIICQTKWPNNIDTPRGGHPAQTVKENNENT